MKERPIIFSGESVREILASQKTQTRRIVKPKPGKQSTWLTPQIISLVPQVISALPSGTAVCLGACC